MTHPSIHARTQPNKIAYQMAGSGKAITYRELDELSNQGAHLFRALGLREGDHIAFLIENRLAFMEICWAAQRSGLYYTAISRYLTQDEIAYIVKDCGAKVVITSPKCAEQIKGLVSDAPDAPLFFMIDDPLPGFRLPLGAASKVVGSRFAGHSNFATQPCAIILTRSKFHCTGMYIENERLSNGRQQPSTEAQPSVRRSLLHAIPRNPGPRDRRKYLPAVHLRTGHCPASRVHLQPVPGPRG